MSIFNSAEQISSEVYSNISKLMHNVNQYNIEEKSEAAKDFMADTQKNIIREIELYKTEVKIDSEGLFLLKDIIETLSTKNNGMGLSLNSIYNLRAYKKLSDDSKEKQLENKIKETRKKLNKELYDVKFKAFESLLHGKNNNAKRYFEVNHFIFEKCTSEDKPEKIIFRTIYNANDKSYGLYFIMTKEILVIKRITSSSMIEYSIKFVDNSDKFNIKIDGYINVNNAHEDINIDETVPNSMKSSVLNSYNLRGIIELFNELYSQSIDDNKKNGDSGNDIDDFLSGKILNT
jgi:hypothetical protein